LQPFIAAALVMATILHAIASVSQTQMTFILAVVRVVLSGALMFPGSANTLTPEQEELVKTVPTDVRAAFKLLNIGPDYVRYACC
ncbi:uncharacterized protein BXZ73DRAFT_4528, partial [Epithele typhae]|uniref:uncharacterized protein n=1 Tax=Epithele typhae TaxID=378194 RepID=UPI0020075E18